MSPVQRLILCAGCFVVAIGCRTAPSKVAVQPFVQRAPPAREVVRLPPPAAPDSEPAAPSPTTIPVLHTVVAEEVPAPPAALDVDWLVHEVEARNPSLQALVFAWQSAAQKYPQAVSLDDPMFMSMIAPGSVNSATTETGYVLEAAQKFPWFGKRDARGQRALADADMAGAQVEDYRQRLVEMTRAAYLDYYMVFRAREINDRNAGLIKSLRESAQARYRANQVTQQDIFQADVELVDLDRKAISLDRQQRLAVARINTLLRNPAGAPLLPPVAVLSADVATSDIEELQQEALAQRADLAAVAAEIREAEAAITLAQKDYYPDVEIFGRYDTFWQPASTQGDLRGQAGMRMNVPIYRNRLQAAYCQAVMRLRQKQAEFEQKQLDLAYEVQSAYEQLDESRRTVALYQDRYLPIAEQSVKAARANYETSKASFLDLLTAQRRLIEARLMQQEAIVSLHRRKAELDRVTGHVGRE
jgi:cobalt-zinc-cadmium efflux system outer membrane protein